MKRHEDRDSGKVTPDNPFELVINDAGELVPVKDGRQYSMDEYRAYYAERVKRYKAKYDIPGTGLQRRTNGK